MQVLKRSLFIRTHINFNRKDLDVVKFINLIICIEIAENNYPPDHDLNW
jgi:hypothetical protein